VGALLAEHVEDGLQFDLLFMDDLCRGKLNIDGGEFCCGAKNCLERKIAGADLAKTCPSRITLIYTFIIGG
jgi:hypothetical protein